MLDAGESLSLLTFHAFAASLSVELTIDLVVTSPHLTST
jgi:hypothetical protein